MLVCDYIVERIDGDYAMLKRTNLPEEEAKMVARALLPEEIREGSRLIMNYFSIQLLNKGMENVCALGLESAGAHLFLKCNFLFRNFSENIKGNGCVYLIKKE